MRKAKITIKSGIISTLAYLLISTSLMAQAPQMMSYQAVIRDINSKLVKNQKVGMQISILQGSATGSAVYEETQTLISNDDGLVSAEIGSGTVMSGNFSAIDWTNGPFYIKTETDPSGGTSYSITGTSQLISVPYALHSNTADSITGVSVTGGSALSAGRGIHIQNDTVNVIREQFTTVQRDSIPNPRLGATIYNTTTDCLEAYFPSGWTTIKCACPTNLSIGDAFGGGVVFEVSTDASGCQHGLIADLTDLPKQAYGGYGKSTGATSTTDGKANTQAIVSALGNSGNAAAACANSTHQGYSDWFLPAKEQLETLLANDAKVNATLNGISNAVAIASNHWSSTESSSSRAYYVSFYNGNTYANNKKTVVLVRAIRAF